MHTPSDAGWLGRNFLRLVFVIFPAACAVFVLSHEQLWRSEQSSPAATAGVFLFGVALLAVPVAVVGGAFLSLVAVLTGVFRREGIALLCASATAAGLVALVALPDAGEASLALWCGVAAILVLGVWSEFDASG